MPRSSTPRQPRPRASLAAVDDTGTYPARTLWGPRLQPAGSAASIPSGCAAALIEIRPSRTSPRSRDPSHTAVTGAPATRQETLAPRRPLQLRSSVEASGTSRPKTKSQEDVTIFRHVHLLGPGTFARPHRPGAQRYLAADSTLVSASFVVSIARISCPRFLSPRPVPYHQRVPWVMHQTRAGPQGHTSSRVSTAGCAATLLEPAQHGAIFPRSRETSHTAVTGIPAARGEMRRPSDARHQATARPTSARRLPMTPSFRTQVILLFQVAVSPPHRAREEIADPWTTTAASHCAATLRANIVMHSVVFSPYTTGTPRRSVPLVGTPQVTGWHGHRRRGDAHALRPRRAGARRGPRDVIRRGSSLIPPHLRQAQPATATGPRRA